MSGYRKRLGAWGEELAARLLLQKGYEIVARNYRVREGELDIVARERDCTVFVEVKTRASAAFGCGREALTPAKIAALTRAAERFIQEKGIAGTPMRFDVIEVDASCKGEPRFTHLKNAIF